MKAKITLKISKIEGKIPLDDIEKVAEHLDSLYQHLNKLGWKIINPASIEVL